MPNQAGMEALLSRLRSGDKAVWSIINELAGKSEDERRRILRPHAEAGFDRETDASLIDQRDRLDVALGALTILEIAGEVGIVPDPSHLMPEVADVQKLFRESEALLRYADAYLYFGARFLAGRIDPPAWMVSEGSCEPPTRKPDDPNRRTFALRVPPALPASPETDASFASFLNLANSAETNEALKFLDDFIVDLKEPEWFELWLRGLRPEADQPAQDRFARLRRGLTDWVIFRCKFYLSLEPPSALFPPATDGRFAAEGGEQRPPGGQMVTNPVAARFGLRDVYWIARLLRADVSAKAVVSYPQSSWLDLLRFRAGLEGNAVLEASFLKAEDVLRSVFGFVCDLIQNAVELSDEDERRAYQPELFTTPPLKTVKWHEVFDEEMDEITRERRRRQYRDSSLQYGGDPPLGESAGPRPNRGDGWFERIKTGIQPHHLIGLAFSGGGIKQRYLQSRRTARAAGIRFTALRRLSVYCFWRGLHRIVVGGQRLSHQTLAGPEGK